MSDDDAIRWDRRYPKYAIGESTPVFNPDGLLDDHAALFNGEGNALDVACGLGANAMWIAERGYTTSAIDCSLAGLSIAESEAHSRELTVSWIHADLDTWTWPSASFSLVTVFRFLDRRLFDKIDASLCPGGLLVYQTFNENQLVSSPEFNPDFVLKFNELNDAFGNFEVIVNDQTGTSTRYVGRKG